MPDAVQALVKVNDVKGLKVISQPHVQNTLYIPKFNIGRNPQGIHGMTPGEPLHMVDLGLFKYGLEGLFKYGLEGFYICLGMNPKSKWPCKILAEVDSMAWRIGRFLSHQSDRGLPRTYFPFDVTGGIKLLGLQVPRGSARVLLIMCHLEESSLLFLKQISS
jgi:hypothetical protein